MKKRTARSDDYLVLTPTEEKILRFFKIQKRKASISELSSSIHLARTSIYNAVDSLIEKRILMKERFEYDLVSNNLTQSERYNTERKINNLLIEMLRLQKGEILYSIESDEEIEYLLKIEKGLPEWQKKIADKGIVLKGIGSTKALSLFRNIHNENLGSQMKRRSGSARFMAETLSGPCSMVSFHKSVVFFSRKNKYFYRIDDANISRFIQAIIETLYLNLQYKPLFI